MALTWYVEWEPKNMKAYRSSHGGDSACDTFIVVGHDCELCAVMAMSRGNASNVFTCNVLSQAAVYRQADISLSLLITCGLTLSLASSLRSAGRRHITLARVKSRASRASRALSQTQLQSRQLPLLTRSAGSLRAQCLATAL